MAKVIPIDDLRLSHRAAKFEGKDDIPVSMFITQYDEGEGPDLHTHPYAEVFVVESGEARFTSGDEEVVAGAGHIVIVPPETVHGFKSTGPEKLRVIGIHPSPTVIQTDL